MRRRGDGEIEVLRFRFEPREESRLVTSSATEAVGGYDAAGALRRSIIQRRKVAMVRMGVRMTVPNQASM